MTKLLPPVTTGSRRPVSTMAPDIAALNRRYLETVRHRALCGATVVNSWQGCTVSVFLRHESDHVFAVAADNLIGMADFVALEQATFEVDEAGRREACQGTGLLPNGRNVHAFVRGRLLWAAMHSLWTVPDDWPSIVYNPHQMKQFQIQHNGQPVSRSETVVFTPRPMQVRCAMPSDVRLRETS